MWEIAFRQHDSIIKKKECCFEFYKMSKKSGFWEMALS